MAQQVSTAPFIEADGLVVMEAESVPRPPNWQFENVEEGFAGAGYLRYIGPNRFSDPGFDVIEFEILITNPGEYRMFTFISHKGAPAPDQENDVWTQMDDGQWYKTVHGGIHIDEGFSHHTNWVEFDDEGNEIFPQPRYDLDAGLHTFRISGRSWNVRIDRIHIWKDSDPNRVYYSQVDENTNPESERNNTILTASPNPVAFSATSVGGSTPFTIDLKNSGNEAITVNDIAITGADASQFDVNANNTIQVGPLSSEPLTLLFEPTSPGSKSAQLEITHTGLNSPAVFNLFGSATSGASGSTVLYRVNAGGPLIEDALADWESDRTVTTAHNVIDAEPGTDVDPSSYVNAIPTGDWTWGQNDLITIHPSVPPGTPMKLFQAGRWDPGAAPAMNWDFPVEAGKEVEVRLYFSEIRFNSAEDQDGPRIFSVQIDGFVYPGMADINLFEEYGHDVGVMKSAVVISDGNVDIDFVNNASDPIVMGIEVVELGSLSRMMYTGWNLVGVPTNPGDNSYASVLDDLSLVSAPFGYSSSGYTQASTLDAGKGYWVNLTEGGSQSFDDDAVQNLTLNLESGWNLISGPGCFLQLSAVSDPGNILMDGTLFAYENGYKMSSALLPGFGYWVQASQAGTVSMSCASANASKQAAAPTNQAALKDFGRIEVKDARRGVQALYFGADLDSDLAEASFSLPPRPIDGHFDVRFNHGGWLDEGTEGVILLQSGAYPLTLELAEMPRYAGMDIRIEEMTQTSVVRSHTLSAGSQLVISDEEVVALKVSMAELVAEVPARFVVRGNYPNPFNPTTQLVFDLPESADVQVSVYDLLGRRVLHVPAQAYSAGSEHRIQVDAGSLASGAYLYHIQADMARGSEIKIGRMTLLK